MYSKIAGTGMYVPERVLTNTDLEKMVDTTDEWIRACSSIERRHIAAEGQTTVDLGELATIEAIRSAGIELTDIDFLIVGTTTPDLVFPNVGCLLQDRLDIHGCAAFSIEAGCSGFLYALSVADKFVASGQAMNALVVGAETLSRMINWEDASTCALFGDGAGAVVLQASDEPGIMSTSLSADRRYKDLLQVEDGSSGRPGLESDAAMNVLVEGDEMFTSTAERIGSIVDEILAANDVASAEIDWLIPHPANIRIIEAAAKRVDIPMEKVILTVQEHGNTLAASLPMSLDVAVKDGRIQRGDLVLLEGLGGGLASGSALFRY